MRRCKALAMVPSPGAIAPPCQTPWLVTRSTVMAVPHETTSPGRPGGMSRRRGEDAQGTIGAAGLGPLDVAWHGNLGGRLKPGHSSRSAWTGETRRAASRPEG